LVAGLICGLVAHEQWPETFPDWIPVPWALAGVLLPYAWLHRNESATKNGVVFICGLGIASPWIPLWLVAPLGCLIIAVWLISTSGKR
jgi:hypothetical protein